MAYLEKIYVSRPVLTALAALAVTLAGCGAEPKTGRLDSDRSNQSVARAAKPSAELPGRAASPAASPSAAPAKAAEDEALTAKVKSALVAEQTLSQSLAIDVDASGGTVILKGVARNHSDREKAMQVASSVAGVKSVRNDLIVSSGS
jgi:hyperosmotically inducible periplasmic protein